MDIKERGGPKITFELQIVFTLILLRNSQNASPAQGPCPAQLIKLFVHIGAKAIKSFPLDYSVNSYITNSQISLLHIKESAWRLTKS